VKWYGYSKCSIEHFLISKKARFRRKSNKSALLLSNRVNLDYYKINFYIPSNWRFLILKKAQNTNFICCYLYSTTYFFLLPFLKNFLSLKYDAEVNFFSAQFLFKNNFYGLFWNYFKLLFYSFSRIFFRKLKFKGKGYYIYKNSRNTIALQFGYSHLIYLYSFFVTVKFITKTIILLFGVNRININNRGHGLFKLKPINVFTGRGIRFSRQIVYRKVGKISSYR
jgi:ribosomal protein L6P/L9E